jgi:hypothetical protein
MRTRSIVLLSVALLQTVALSPAVLAAEPTVKGLQFPLGERSGANPAARVLVAQIVQSSQKRGFFRVAMLPILVADGVTVTFYRPDAESLTVIHETIRALARVDKFELRRLCFRTEHDPAPRLMAEEILVRSPDTWTLKRVQLAGRPGLAECQLVLKKSPDGGLFFGDGQRLSLAELLGQPEPTPTP